MDVVRITQALRQQNPARQANSASTRGSGGGSNSLAHSPAAKSASLRRDTWDGSSLTVNTSFAAASSSPSTPASSNSRSNNNVSPSSASPSSTFSLASYLPAALTEISSGFFGNQINGSSPSRMSLASVAGSTNLAEMEVQSLLLRSMPMFGNLISKE